MKRFGALAVIATLACVIPFTAQARLYKCKDPSGAVTYKDTPCMQTEQRQSTERDLDSTQRRGNALPRPNEPGLWETVTVMRPRASHQTENAGIQQTPRKELDKMGDTKYFLGVPMKTRECALRSPIEAILTQWGSQCERQIRAQAGTCEASVVRGGTQESIDSISGDYRGELHVNRRHLQGKDAAGKQIYDESEMHFSYLGTCKSDMKPGDVFLVEDDGHLVRQR